MDIVEPVFVCGLIFCRIKVHLAFHYRREGDVGKVLHSEEPLERETRFDGCIGITLRISHLIIIVFHALHESSFLQVDGYLLAAVEAVHAYIEWRLT